MSKNVKALIAAAGLVVLLTAGYFIAKNYKSAKFEERLAAVRPEEIKLSSLVSDTVVKIEVPTTGIHLEKKGEDWESVPADPYRLNQDEIKGMTWSLSNMRADRIIDEAPKDLKPYGLDPPLWHTIITTSDGIQVEFFGGERTPSRSGYYAMVKGDPRVYQVPTYPGERLYLAKKDIRDRKLASFGETGEVRQFILQTDKTRIQIEAEGGDSVYMMSSPYKVPCKVDAERFAALMYFFQEMSVSDFDEDNPASLEPYGLDKPAAQVFIQSADASLRILFGKSNGAQQFAKLGGSPGVFLVRDVSPALRAQPFDLVDRYVCAPAIETVDSFVINGAGKTLRAEVKRQDGGETYFLNGRQAGEDSFRDFYRACVSLSIDAEYPNGPAAPAAAEVSLEYTLNTGEKAQARLAPYNRDFYALAREGAAEFLVSRQQVQKIFTAADKVEFTATTP
ncbi:MAG: DUF4340 domain-containing protein [Spirochaetales bacterium]|jgi:hypothetical protein|nr:DUF4340 domain-containing protein [Spirochaetales bacterium]